MTPRAQLEMDTGLSLEDQAWDAVVEGDLEGLRALVEAGVSLQARYTENRVTLAHIAAVHGQLEILQWVVEREPSLLTATSNVRVPSNRIVLTLGRAVTPWLTLRPSMTRSMCFDGLLSRSLPS